ncbi:hypothetical protein [Pseudoalteromonas denitrificans]|uniref:Spermidine synthase n=1 Tax=Pseudoalteromonas denitrificans DSM 6059 TaxID=1123010 RepID=A0A1I1SV96_9GAMM|nr:hypothetical protein [Pseudoalteromonas denitrificans]SFD50419.1 spermidine synthase [Pseudoalteromonas denitrificans DSM 6059]
MDFLTTQAHDGELLFHRLTDQQQIEIRQNNGYRWLYFKECSQNNAFQSVISLKRPSELMFPYTQAMLLFLLWKKAPISLLNLGMGTGSLERALRKKCNIKITSVESNKYIVEMAEKYFYLPKKINILIESAEKYLIKNTHDFDVILCDIFNGKDNSESIYDEFFYQTLKNNLDISGVVFLNILAKNSGQLQEILYAIRQSFKHVVLLEFENYENILLIISQQHIPSKTELYKLSLNDYELKLNPFINNLFYVPALINE